jgi:hypothetical protein
MILQMMPEYFFKIPFKEIVSGVVFLRTSQIAFSKPRFYGISAFGKALKK